MEQSKLSGGIQLTISSLLFMISGYIINIWLGRKLGPTTYGVYGLMISLMTTINIIQQAGLPQATAKFLAEDESKKDAILKSSLFLQICSTTLLTLVFFLTAPLIANLLQDVGLTSYIRLTSLILPFYSIFTLYTSYYNGLHKFHKQARLLNAYSIIKAILVIGCAYLFSLYGAILGFIIAPLLTLLFGIEFPRKHTPAYEYKRLIRFSLPLIGFAILSTLLVSVDVLFVKALTHDTTAAGLYTAAQNIARIPYFALGAFAVILFPSISRAVSRGDHNTAKSLTENAVRYLLLLLIPGTALIAATSKQLLSLMYSATYSAAASPLSLLVIGLAFLTLFTMLANIMSGAGKPRVSLWLAGGGLATTAIACSVLIPRFQLSGAAVATGIGSAAACIAALWYTRQLLDTVLPWMSLLRIVVASAIITATTTFIHVPIFALPILYAVMLALYIALLIATKEITKHDLQILQRLTPTWVPYIHSIK